MQVPISANLVNLSTMFRNTCRGRSYSIFSKSQKTFYELLKVQPASSQADIKSSFYELSKLYHPDKVLSLSERPAALAQFLAIKEAYETLSNPSKRVLYDQSLGLSSLGLGALHSKSADFSAWSSPSGIPPQWTVYQERASDQTKSWNPFAFTGSQSAFMQDGSHGIAQDAASPWTFVYVLLTGSLVFIGSVGGLLLYYQFAIEKSPSQMQDDINRHRARAIVLEFNPNDQGHTAYMEKYRRFEPGPQWTGKTPPAYSIGATK